MSASVHARIHRQTPPHAPADSYCSGWYTSYWNAFFFVLILLVDGDRHSDGYVTLIVVNANKIFVLPIWVFVFTVNTPVHGFCRD